MDSMYLVNFDSVTCDLQDPVSEELRKAADEVPITCPMLVTIDYSIGKCTRVSPSLSHTQCIMVSKTIFI